MPRRAALVPLALALVLVAGACSSDDGSTVASASSSAPATTTTTTTAPTTTTTVVPSQPAGSANEAATRFVNAWKAGDRDAAAAIAVPAAVDAVFSAGDAGSVSARGCNTPPEGPVLCVYATGPGELQVRVSATPDGSGFYVDQARLTPT